MQMEAYIFRISLIGHVERLNRDYEVLLHVAGVLQHEICAD